MIILDTAVWVALFKRDDTCHELANKLLKGIRYEDLWVFEHTYSETLTVLRSKISEKACWVFKKFFETFKIEIIISDEKIFTLANGYFFLYKNLSFTDSLILASAILNNLQLITFDKELQKAWLKSKS